MIFQYYQILLDFEPRKNGSAIREGGHWYLLEIGSYGAGEGCRWVLRA